MHSIYEHKLGRMRRSLLLVVVIVSAIVLSTSGRPSVAEAVTNTMLPFIGTNDQGNGLVTPIYSISTTGRYVAFISSSTNLIPSDSNGTTKDAYIFDNHTGTVAIASVSNTGQQPNNEVQDVKLTGNGRYLLFTTKASNLSSPGGSNGRGSVYLRDLVANLTYPIALSVGGSPGETYKAIDVSEDGRFVLYRKSSNTNELYVRDRLSNTDKRVDTDASGQVANYPADGDGALSCDGRFAVFTSAASNLVSGDTNGKRDVFLADLAGDISLVRGVNINGNDHADTKPVLSCDGNYILYSSKASNLVSGDTNGFSDLFKYDIARDSTDLVSLDNSGNQYGDPYTTTGYVNQIDVSLDGRYIVFATQTVTQGPQGQEATGRWINLRDTKDNATTILAGGNGVNPHASNPAITFDGTEVFYTEHPQNNFTLKKLHKIEDYL